MKNETLQGTPAGLLSSEEQEAVRRQLAYITASPLFRHSKRFPDFLRYTVEEALDGRLDQLKERTLGVEVFGRHPDYDTNSDPVVRMTAVAVRKRLAQYYQLPGHDAELRIEFPRGSYVPDFKFPKEAEPADTHHMEEVHVDPPKKRSRRAGNIGSPPSLFHAPQSFFWHGKGILFVRPHHSTASGRLL